MKSIRGEYALLPPGQELMHHLNFQLESILPAFLVSSANASLVCPSPQIFQLLYIWPKADYMRLEKKKEREVCNYINVSALTLLLHFLI
jgi:hypothetical protein